MRKPRQSTIDKYTRLCAGNGFEYRSHYSSKSGNIISCKCNICYEIVEFQSKNVIRGDKRCSSCLVLKYQSKCLELGFEYRSHYCNQITMIKAKCLWCEYINDFQSNHLLRNSVKCKCFKKVFVKGYVYKLTIGEYFYIGITDTTMRTRYGSHKKSCFNRSKPVAYRSKIYKTIRDYIKSKEGRTPVKEDFPKYVIQTQVAEIYTSYEDLKSLETELICLNNPWCLNSIL